MSQPISSQTAIDMTTLHRAQRENILDTSFKSQNILPKCETFDRDVFDTVLAQTGCEAVRIYYGMDEDKKVHAIIVGVNGDGEDMFSSKSDSNAIFEEATRCPNDCPPSSDLNS